MTYSADGLDVVLDLLRDGLEPAITVVSRLPDHLLDYLPLVLVRRTGGASSAPRFYDDYLLNVQCYAGGPGVADPSLATFELAEDVRGVLWDAVRNQTVTPSGWLIDIRESSGPQEFPDSDLPLLGRYIATYDLRVRRPSGP